MRNPIVNVEYITRLITQLEKPNYWVAHDDDDFDGVGEKLQDDEPFRAADMLTTLLAERGAFEWRPIATAPKDGTRFLAWPCELQDGPAVVKAYWYVHPSVQAWITDELDCTDYDFNPTVWVPLPQGPLPSPVQNSGNAPS
jgi:hypothetical protein